MKARELIELLERFDIDQEVTIAVKQYNKVYPVAYVAPFATDNFTDVIRIQCTLPDNMYTVTKKEKLS